VVNKSNIRDVISAAKEIFCNGIYIPSDYHPCGWDFISFEDIDKDEEGNYDVGYIFKIYDISGGNYDIHDYTDCTLQEILEKTDGKFSFERSGIDWD